MKHPPTPFDELRATAEALGVVLTRTQAALLIRLENLLLERAIPLGAVSASDEGRIRERHIVDCLRAAAFVDPAITAYDLGSGAGLPGVVVAIAKPGLRVGLLETRRRRAAFLELLLQELGLSNAWVHAGRVEDVHGAVDLCFARAFAPLNAAWAAAAPLLLPDGKLVYFAGRNGRTLEAPAGGRIVAVHDTAVLESAGPLVIMARQ